MMKANHFSRPTPESDSSTPRLSAFARAVLAAAAIFAAASAWCEPEADPELLPEEEAPVPSRVESLRKENELLRKENQALRRQVVALRSRLGTSTAERAAGEVRGEKGAAVDEEAAKVKPDNENDEHWLSGSGKRHNSSCRYFKTGNGRICTESEGVPCRVCGG